MDTSIRHTKLWQSFHAEVHNECLHIPESQFRARWYLRAFGTADSDSGPAGSP